VPAGREIFCNCAIVIEAISRKEAKNKQRFMEHPRLAAQS
jgi:hypothetical protein